MLQGKLHLFKQIFTLLDQDTTHLLHLVLPTVPLHIQPSLTQVVTLRKVLHFEVIYLLIVHMYGYMR